MYREATHHQTEPIRSDLYWALDLRDNVMLTTLLLILISGFITAAYTVRIAIQSARRHRWASYYHFDQIGQTQQPFIL